ncbi:hypothetical protein HK099_000455 [Clydaea vesicula]|uniref:Thioredoxin domain-containing protein n=1 Tax=Clydaea vesicula TaxID=447962 RepID=A0AAD5U494_9FUNG|nr:hypothetical protein HK099_000455 [Clydaea vesicula]
MKNAPVGDRKYWKENEDHPYKLNQLLKLKAIPTLMEFNKNLELVQKLVERECYDISKLEKFFENPSFVVDDDDDENCNIRACANCCIVS